MEIYKVTNKINGKIYIGKTIHTMKARRDSHISKSFSSKCSKIYFHRAIRKYGVNNFVWKVLETGINNEKILDKKECYYIQLLKANKREYGYNLTSGGDGISGWHHYPETLKKISAFHKGKIVSKETREKIKNSKKNISKETRKIMSVSHKGNKNHKGHFHSKKTKQKISLQLLGKKLSRKTREKMSKAHKGFHHSQKSKDKVSISKKGKLFSLKHRLNLSKSHLGQKPSKKARENMSNAQKKRQAALRML